MILTVASNKTNTSIIMFIIISMLYDVDSSISKMINNIYMLPKVNDTYDSYRWRTGINKDSYTYNKIFDEVQFFHIEYNLKSRRLPTNAEDNTYDGYTTNFGNYCKNEYKSYNTSGAVIEMKKFKTNVNNLMRCLNKNNAYDEEKTLKEILEDCLVKKTNANGSRFCSGLEKSGKIDCLIKKLSNNQKKNLLDCIDEIPEISKEVNSSGKSNLTEDKKLKMFHTKDLNLLKDVIKEELALHDIPTMTTIFQNYTDIKPVANNNSDESDCMFYIMSEETYTATRKTYEIFQKSIDENFEMFDSQLKEITPILNNISTKNRSVMKLKTNLETINHKQYEKYKKSIRAIQIEDDYTLYAIRLLIKGYMPLTNELWIKERNSLDLYRNDIELEESLACENN